MVLSDISIRRPVLATVMSLLLVTFGVVSYTRLQVREFPDIDPPVVTIDTRYRGASAAVVETRVTQLIEDRIGIVEAIRSIESSSSDGQSTITVQFDTGRDIDGAANDLREAVSGIARNLPTEADPPEITKEDSATEVMMWLNLASENLSQVEMYDYADRYLADRFSVIPGVARIRVSGSSRYAMRVWVDRQALAARGLVVGDIEEALRRENIELPAGTLQSLDRQFTVRTRREFLSEEDFRSLVVARGEDGYLVRLGEVSRVELAASEPRRSFRGNAVPMVSLGVIRQSQANTLDVARAVKLEAERVRPQLPEGMELLQSYDTSVFIEESIKQVKITLGVAVCLVILVIYLFLGSLRATLVPAVTVPVSLVSSLIVLSALGFSINTLTLLALVLAIGLVVDDAIVVLENVYHRIEEGEPPLAASFLGTRQVAFAVIATTVVLVSVFVPISFLEGDLGKLFTEFAITLAVAVSFSSFVALSLSPMLASRVLTQQTARGNWITKASDAAFRKVESGYRWSLGHFLRVPWLALLVVFGVIWGAGWLYRTLPSEFTPREDRGNFFVVTSGPEGTTYGAMSEIMEKVEERLLYLVEEGEAIRVLVRAPRAFGATNEFHEGITIVVLSDWSQRRSAWEIIDEVRDRLSDIPGVRNFTIMRQGLTRGLQKPVQFIIGGPTYEDLATWRDLMLAEMAENPNLVGVDHDYKETRPQIGVAIDRNRAGDLGVSIENVGMALESLLGSRRVTTFILDGKEYDVLIESEYDQKFLPNDLSNIQVRSDRTGALIPLSNLVTLTEFADSGTLNRYNRVRAVTIEASLADGYSLGEALDYLDEAAERVLPDGAIVFYKGESLEFKDSGRSALFVFALALVVVFLVLSAQFESFVHPLVIFFAVPVAIAGGLFGLWLFGMAQSIYTQIGSIMLVGLAAKNGILIVEFINQLREKGEDFDDAVLNGSVRRLRPIIMTGLTTVAGSTPLVISFGAGSETRSVIGVVILFGVGFAAIFTLFVVPLGYRLIARRTGSPGATARRLEASLLEVESGVAASRKSRKESGSRKAKKVKRSKQSGADFAETETESGERGDKIGDGESGPSPSSSAGPILLMLGAISLALITGGCIVGPDYERPDLAAQLPAAYELPDGWKVAAPADTDPLGRWWSVFQDAKLNQLMDRAKEANQDLAGAFHRIEQARAASRGARASWLPGIDFEPSVYRQRRSGTTRSTAQNLTGVTTTNLSLPLVLNYEIDLWGQLHRGVESLDAEVLESESLWRHTLLTLQSELALQYLNLRGIDAEIATYDGAVALRRTTLDLNRRRFEAGDTDEVDVSRAETELATTRAELVGLRKTRGEIERAIAVLVGAPSSGFSVPPAPLRGIPPSLPSGLRSDLLERRPDIAAAERRVMAENARIGVAKGAFYPVVSLSATAGLESGSTARLFDIASRTWGVGPSVSVPVFDYGRNRANLERAEARYDEVVADYRKTVLEAVREVEDALAARRFLAEQAEAQERAVVAARRTVDLTRQRHEAGVTSFFEVVDAQRVLLDAEREAVRLRTARHLAAVALVKALGGGWEEAR